MTPATITAEGVEGLAAMLEQRAVRSVEAGRVAAVEVVVADALRSLSAENARLRARLAEAGRVVDGLLGLENGTLSDVSTAHSLRGDGASQWMREDDHEFRQSLREAFRAAHTWKEQNDA